MYILISVIVATLAIFIKYDVRKLPFFFFVNYFSLFALGFLLYVWDNKLMKMVPVQLLGIMALYFWFKYIGRKWLWLDKKDKKVSPVKKKRKILYVILLVIGLVIFAGYLHRMMVANQERKEMLSYYNSKELEVALVCDDVYILNREGNWDKLKLDVGSVDRKTLLFTKEYIFYEDGEQKNICMYDRKTFKVTKFPEEKYRSPCQFALVNGGTELLFCAKVPIENQSQSDTVFAKLNLQSSDHVIKELYRSPEDIYPYFSKDGKEAYFNKKGYVHKLNIDSATVECIVKGAIFDITDDAILIYNYHNDCYSKYILDNGKRNKILCGDFCFVNVDRQGTCLLTWELNIPKVVLGIEFSLHDIKSGQRYKLPPIKEYSVHSAYVWKD